MRQRHIGDGVSSDCMIEASITEIVTRFRRESSISIAAVSAKSLINEPCRPRWGWPPRQRQGEWPQLPRN